MCSRVGPRYFTKSFNHLPALFHLSPLIPSSYVFSKLNLSFRHTSALYTRLPIDAVLVLVLVLVLGVWPTETETTPTQTVHC